MEKAKTVKEESDRNHGKTERTDSLDEKWTLTFSPKEHMYS